MPFKSNSLDLSVNANIATRLQCRLVEERQFIRRVDGIGLRKEHEGRKKVMKKEEGRG